MNKYTIKSLYLFLSLLVLFGIFVFPFFVNAENSTSAIPLVFNPPCAEKIGILPLGPCTPITDIQTYIVRLYQFAVGISGIVAVGMIVYGAIIIIVKSEDISAKSEGRQIIQDALWGVLLLFASYLLLQSINPDLVKLKDPSAQQIATSTLTQGTLNKISSTTCGMSVDIRAVDGVPIYSNSPNKSQQPNNKCGLRRVLFREKADINDTLPSDYSTLDDFLNNRNGSTTEAKFFYNEDEILEKDTIAWTYPYYIKGQSPTSTARCVIYAVREPVPEGEKATTMMVDLNQNITPCMLDDVPTSTIKEIFDVDVAEPVKQLPGWVWGNDPDGKKNAANCSGVCPEPMKTGSCAVENLKKTSWKNESDTTIEQASRICAAESGGSETLGSGMDVCDKETTGDKSGPTVSWGLFQINLSAHSPLGKDAQNNSIICADKALFPLYTSKNHWCAIPKVNNYTACMEAAKTGQKNVEKAYMIYKSAGWGQWGANCKCNF